MNRQGITLVEFIISVALVAVVMMFLFNLLVDVQYNSRNGNYASDNQLNRASIVRAIMDDFTTKGLVGVTDSSNSNYLILTFSYQDGSSEVLSVGNRTLFYKDERWSLKSRNDRTNYQTRCVPYQFENDENSDYFYVHIRIPVVIDRALDNTIDDIDLFYVGSSKDINSGSFPSKSFLGYNSNSCSS